MATQRVFSWTDELLHQFLQTVARHDGQHRTRELMKDKWEAIRADLKQCEAFEALDTSSTGLQVFFSRLAKRVLSESDAGDALYDLLREIMSATSNEQAERPVQQREGDGEHECAAVTISVLSPSNSVDTECQQGTEMERERNPTAEAQREIANHGAKTVRIAPLPPSRRPQQRTAPPRGPKRESADEHEDRALRRRRLAIDERRLTLAEERAEMRRRELSVREQEAESRRAELMLLRELVQHCIETHSPQCTTSTADTPRQKY